MFVARLRIRFLARGYADRMIACCPEISRKAGWKKQNCS